MGEAHHGAAAAAVSAVTRRNAIAANPVALQDELIERYGTGAVLSVSPYMADRSGEILRWVLLIDRDEVPTADVRVSERYGWSVMVLHRRE